MSVKKLLAAAALVAFAAPAFAQEEIRVTAEQCVDLGGTVNQAAGTCTGVSRSALAGNPETAGLLEGGVATTAAVAGVGILLVLALGDDDTTTTTTTTGSP